VDTGLVDTGLVDTGLVDTGLVDTGLMNFSPPGGCTRNSSRFNRTLTYIEREIIYAHICLYIAF